ncbi:hypothetical protein PBN151_4387 [Paenibacillus sp. NAIST15-1]|nr:hypothetical protein PBN151_4387 [Paenibacillus sp. NAIST15-1]
MDKIMSLTHERGSDVIIEFLANVNLETDLEIIAPYGRIGVVGNRGSLERSYYPLIKDQIIRREGRLPTNRKELFLQQAMQRRKKGEKCRIKPKEVVLYTQKLNLDMFFL